MKSTKKYSPSNPDFELKKDSFLPVEENLHRYGKNDHIICLTDSRGYPQPNNKSITEIRVDASNGFIPLWDKEVTLNWRFNKSFGSFFKNAAAAKTGVRKLFGEAIVAWGVACPVRFHEDDDAWDFEVMMHNKDCDQTGCVLAQSFFPGTAQNTFYIYPTMFEQSHQEQKETIEHEMGHVFGLRHFFANISEKDSKSELFGKDNPFSIMNYGAKSKLTDDDKKDLKRLYDLVWSGALTEINGTRIRKFISFTMRK